MKVDIFLSPVKDDSFLDSKCWHFGVIMMVSTHKGIGVRKGW